ncbi:hypothetical protein [Flaviaesturariibacter amylovorans]|uniref:Anti-sigma factor n=1 Tax=Flaviaesturariibacter amylovorans TaxID=1084520 RepID=A0ABP8G4K9_9BACT
MSFYTPEDLLRYIYKEMAPDEAAAVDAELAGNWALREKLAVLRSAHDRLNSIVETPRTETVLNILRYAQATQPSPLSPEGGTKVAQSLR